MAAVSALALMGCCICFGSLTQEGIRPQLAMVNARLPDSSRRTTGTDWDGAILKRGFTSGSFAVAKRSLSLAGELFRAKRPHISIYPLKPIMLMTRHVLLPRLDPVRRHRVLGFRE